MDYGEQRPPERWLGVGHAAEADPAAAAATAVAGALEGRRPSAVLLFASIDYDPDALLRAAAAALPPATPLAGCTTAGELSGRAATTSGVVAVALGGPGLEASLGIGLSASGDQRAAGAAAAACTTRLSRPNKVLLLLTPGLVTHQEEIVRGAYSVTGATVPIVGGAAGDGLTMAGSRLFADGQVLADAVVAVGIASDAPIGLAMRHGWRKVGEAMVVTAGDGARIDQLDDRPALDAYLERLDAPPEAYHDPLAHNHFSLLHPLGLQRANGEDVRVPGEPDYERRALVCAAEVPPGALVWLMEGDDASVLESATLACEDALGMLGGRPPVGAVVFDCVGRRMVLGEKLQKEVDAVRAGLGSDDVAFGGFFTYGEIARARGSSGVHNETFVVMVLA